MALALVLSQSLGQLHAIKHGSLAPAPHVMAAQEASKTHLDGGFLKQLFSSHSSSTDCRLYDQLGNGYALPAVALLQLPAVLPSLLVAVFAGEALARWAALFDARGPPLTF
jgi:hypothetical protein